MPRTVTLIRIFIASPSDVAPERASLERVINELNATLASSLNIRFELLTWETHTYPSVGADPQDAINSQIGDDYDVFIGVLGTHFGTETGRAGSGTEEEFDRVYSRWEANPQQVRIMFYLKDAPIRPSEIDISQYARVLAFRQKLQDRGVLYHTYTDADSFPDVVRIHLGLQAPAFREQFALGSGSDASDRQTALAPAAPPSVVDRVQAEEDETGFLELIDLADDSFATASELASRFTSAMTALGEKAESRGSELETAVDPAGNADMARGRRIINQMAQDMEQFVALATPIVPQLAGALRAGFDALSRAAIARTSFQIEDPGDIAETLAIVRGVRDSTQSSLVSTSDLRAIIAGLPRITTPFNRARRGALSVLDSYQAEMTSAIALAEDTTGVLQRIVDEHTQGTSLG
jgi:hypothetical protein